MPHVQHPGNVTVRVGVPNEEENAKYNFNGKEIQLRGVGIRTCVLDQHTRPAICTVYTWFHT